MNARCAVAPNLQVPHIETSVAYATDWDGTAGIVDQNMHLLTESASDFYGGIANILANARAQSAGHDGSFDPLAETESLLTDDQFDTCGELFIASHSGRQTLYDDTAAYLSKLQEVGTAHFILTHGKNPLWQMAKVVAGLRQAMRTAGTHGAAYVEVITGLKEKGPHIADTFGPDGTFDFLGLNTNGQPVAVFHAKTLQLVDDRSYSHEGLPRQACGVLLKRPEAPLARRNEMVSAAVQDRVQVLCSLSELSVASTMAMTDCVRLPEETAPAIPAGFRPAYAHRPAKPGRLVTPQTTFRELRAAAAWQKMAEQPQFA